MSRHNLDIIDKETGGTHYVGQEDTFWFFSYKTLEDVRTALWFWEI